MTLPPFYDASKVGQLYAPDVQAAIEAGARAGLSPAEHDRRRVILLLVDAQVDFIHPDGALYVPGAVDDTRRTIEWLYRHAGVVTAVAASLDTHVPMQIFYPTWWRDAAGAPPPPFTAITADDVRRAAWQPTAEPDWSVAYVEKLEQQARKTLMIWPYHTMLGTPGHAIAPSLYEAIAYHAAARHTEPIFLSKGYIPKTEHYSILEPEVKVPDAPLGELNTGFLDMLATYDLIYVAGQAKSHCVLETVTSIMNAAERHPAFPGKLRLLVDCMSSVQHPEIDFEAMANEAFAQFEVRGMRIVTSQDDIG